MDELFARIQANGQVELADENRTLGLMKPQSAALLARRLLSCATAQLASNSPPAGTIVDGAQLLPSHFQLRASPFPDGQTIGITVLDVEFDFRLPAHDARAIGEALISFANAIEDSAGTQVRH